MSKIYSYLVVSCLLLVSMESFADNFEVDGIFYKTDYNDKTIAIVTSAPMGKNKYSGIVKIPESVNYNGKTLKVTTIEYGAFKGCSELTSIIIPNSIKSIEDQAFSNCTGITSISLPSSIESMGNYVFSFCSSLSSFVWPDSLSVIPSGTFMYCKNLTSIQIPDFITFIGNGAFEECNNLIDVRIGKSVTEIGKQAFQGCERLETIDIPSSVKTIGFWAFRSCGFKEILIPSNVVSLGEGCFSSCFSLSSIKLSEGLDSIGSNCFDMCDLLSIDIPASVKSIGSNPFTECHDLKSISVNVNNKKYCSVEGVLYTVEKDTLLAFPNALGENYTCHSATKAIAPYAFYWTKVSDVTLNNGLLSIGEEAFNFCSNLRTITLPSSIKIFGKSSFYVNLKTIVSNIESPSDISIEVFSLDHYDKSTLFVPQGTMGRYKSATGWKEFKDIKEMGLYETKGFQFEIDYSTNTATLVKKNNSYYSGYLKIPNEFVYGGNTITVTAIGEGAFENCSNLIQIEINKSIRSIGDNAFKGCTKLEHITSLIPIAIKISDNVFSDVYEKATLLVPMEKKSEYEKADGWKNFKSIREIDNNTNLTWQNSACSISYLTDLRAGTAKVTYIQNNAEYVEIPEKVSVYDYDLTVNEIASTIFKYAKKDTLQSVSFPATLTKIDNGIFGECPKLSAIIWNSSTRKPEDDLVKNIANPNLLFYVPSINVRPNYMKNIIVNGNADEITLDNHPNGNFYCPKEFIAKKITYTHNYSMKTIIGKSQGWETIVLPFDVQRYKTGKGDIYPFALGVSDRIFWLKEITGTGFVNASVIKANTPYIISMPNSDWYQDIYNIKGDVEFYSENAIVKESFSLNNISLGSRQFRPSYQYRESSTDTYVLNVNNSEIEYTGSDAPGSVFIRDLRIIHPFECYIEDKVSQARAISIADFTTGIDDINLYNSHDNVYAEGGVIIVESKSEQNIPIYNISGQLVRNFKVNAGKNVLSGLPSGLYVIKGRKYVVN